MNERIISFGPIGEDWIKAYADASKDDNPIHQPGSELGIVPLVHGALLAGLLQRAAHELLGEALEEIGLVFLQPVRQGAIISFSIARSRTIQEASGPRQQFRIIGRIDGDKVFVMADCVSQVRD